MPRRLLLPAAALAAAAFAPALASAREPADVVTPFEGRVLAAPSPVLTTDGRRHLVYELKLHNWTPQATTIERLEVRSGGSDRLIARYGGRALRSLLNGQPGAPDDPKAATLPGRTATIAWIDIALPARATPPRSLVHRMRTRAAGSRLTFALARTPVRRLRPLVIAPPLRGENLLDANGCCGHTPHRQALQTIDGRQSISQRYAIDFVQVEGGSSFSGDPRANSSYHIYGDAVYSATPGVVTSVLDGRPDQTPPDPDPTLTATNAARYATGNHVVVRVRRGVYAVYAHLQPGSLRVRRGERVTPGQPLALVGNSGNSTEAHLHFQISTRNGVLTGEGLPYVFDRFGLTGRLSGPTSVEPLTANVERTRELPMTDDVLRFP